MANFNVEYLQIFNSSMLLEDWGGVSGGLNYFLTVVLKLQEMHSIFTKKIFFSRGHAP